MRLLQEEDEMKRIMITKIGEPKEVLEVHNVPDLSPKKGEVLVEMLAIPIHPADLLVMRGRHVFTPSYPCGTGIEGVGQIVAHGEGVSSPPLGARVSLPYGGTWAEQVTISAESVIPLPADMDIFAGSMLALNPVTALGLLMGMSAGDWLIHNAANSSLGRLITRVAAHKGIQNISVVRRPGLEQELLRNGANHVLVDGDDLAERVRLCTGGRGVDRALDAVAGKASSRLFHCIEPQGELVCYGLLGSDEIVLPAQQLIFRPIRVRGYSRLRSLRSLSPEQLQELYSTLFEGMRLGLFETPILATFRFEEILQAVELSEKSKGEGKVLLLTPAYDALQKN